MSRRTERAILGLLSFVVAVFGLVVGVRFVMGDGAVDVAASTADVVDGPAIAGSGDDGAAGGDAAGGVGVPESLVVSTTVASGATTTSVTATVSTDSTPTTATPVDSSDPSTSSSTPEGDATTTTTSAETTVPDTGGDSVTTSTTAVSSSTTKLTTPSTVAGTELTEIEREIVRLTNELRTNPSGPHRRQGSMPECAVPDKGIEVDPETGHPRPVLALTPSLPVSTHMARDWSQQMADADAMSHRSAESQDAIYADLGISWVARGENVAWAVGYELSDVALLFFQGWRESDGHYCNMMSDAFTHIGIGHVRTDGGKDFATQNFYRPG